MLQHIRKFIRHRHTLVAIITAVAVFSLFKLYTEAKEVETKWVLQSVVGQQRTYPTLSVGGVDFGNLTFAEVDAKLNQLDAGLKHGEYKLINGANTQTIALSAFHTRLDRTPTLDAIFASNKLGLADRRRFQTDQGSRPLVVRPVVRFDQTACVAWLKKTVVLDQPAVDARPVFDGHFHVIPETYGQTFNPNHNCELIISRIEDGERSGRVFMDRVAPSATARQFANATAAVNALLKDPVTLRYAGKTATISPEQMFAALVFPTDRSSGERSVRWNSTSLQNLVNAVVDQTTTTQPPPPLAKCEYLVAPASTKLDAKAIRQILTTLDGSQSRDFDLPLIKTPLDIGRRAPSGDTHLGTVYLTYDDGLTYADHIMDEAACYGAKVSFFEVGSRAGQDASQLKRAIAEGHSVQSHAFYHLATNYGSGHDYDWQNNDIASSITALTQVTGVRPTYFRPPGGNKTDDTYRAAAANQLTLVMWTLSSADTAETFNAANVCQNVLDHIKPNSNVLMHSTLAKTSEAVDCIMGGLTSRGYAMRALR